MILKTNNCFEEIASWIFLS